MAKLSYRTCIACREKKTKENFYRITRSNDDNIMLEDDNKKKLNGRSVYICRSKDCLDKVYKRKMLNRMLKTTANLEDVYDKIIKLK